MKCPFCDQEHPDGTRVCPTTGKPIMTELTCPNCGEKIEPQWIVCPKCGTLLQTSASAGELSPEEHAADVRLAGEQDTAKAAPVEPVVPTEPVAEPAIVPQKPKKRRPLGWVACGCLGLPLIILLLVVLLVWTDPLKLNLWGRFTGRYDASAEMMPADTGIYLGINIGNIILTRADRVISPFNVTEQASLSPSGFNYRPAQSTFNRNQQATWLEDMLQQIEVETGVKIPEDVSPWIGQYAGVGVVNVQDSGFGTPLPGGWIIAMEARNNRRADAFLTSLSDNLVELQDMTFTHETYNGAVLTIQDVPADEIAIAFGRSGRIVLLASDVGILKNAIDTRGEKSLATLENYGKLTANRPRSWSASIYLNSELITDFTNEIMQGNDLSSATPLVNPYQITSWTGIQINALAMQNGLRFDSYITYDSSKQSTTDEELMQSLTSHPAAVIHMLPEDTLLYIAGPRFDILWKESFGQALSGGGDPDLFQESFEQTFGFSLQDDLLDHLQGQWALYLLPSTTGFMKDKLNLDNLDLSISLLAQADDSLDIQSISEGLNTSGEMTGISIDSSEQEGITYYQLASYGIEDPMFSFTNTKGYFLLSTDMSATQTLFSDQALLVDTLAYKTAVDALPPTMHPSIYVNLKHLFGNMREGMPPVEQENFNNSIRFFGPIEMIALGNRLVQPGLSHSSIAILLGQE